MNSVRVKESLAVREVVQAGAAAGSFPVTVPASMAGACPVSTGLRDTATAREQYTPEEELRL